MRTRIANTRTMRVELKHNDSMATEIKKANNAHNKL